MKFAAGVTLYNPSADNILNIINYSGMFDIVYVRDNSRSNEEYINRLSQLKNVVYMYDGNNLGLPKVYNEILNCCKKDAVDVLATFDQDSIVSRDVHKQIVNYILNAELDNIGVVALDPVCEATNSNNSFYATSVEWSICSGSYLVLRNIFNQKIQYDENYFIDRFDADFSKQVKKKGLQIIKLNGLEIEHCCGDIKSGEHSPLRNYYIFRNRYYYNDKYYNKPVAKIRSIMQDARQIVWILLKEQSKKEKLRVMKLARKDYRNRLMGKVPSQTLDIILSLH